MLFRSVLFRVAQEALTNVARHARCAEASLRLATDSEGMVLLIQDRGVGFDLLQYGTPQSGLGLAGMRERAASVGGKLNIQSSPGTGTLVEIVVPLNASSRGVVP